ncbi:unnamed protein product [Phytomonas sp. Hart1]|nr:unnamed protein product [Phytomonas sp. Hart1]|eukprot:CCW69917.1 unnamed protein product [Phytomonas sp. isolate Hart1]
MRCWRSTILRICSLAGSNTARFPLIPSFASHGTTFFATATPPSISSLPLQEEMQAKGFVNSTPNFSYNFSDATSTSDSSVPFAFQTTPALGVDLIKDLHGPWLVMTDDLQGELFVDHDAFLYYRPANGIGYGVGKINLLSGESELGSAFDATLMVYSYSQTERFAPLHGITLQITGMVNKVSAKPPQSYTTFSLIGIWQKDDPNADPNQDGNLSLGDSYNQGKLANNEGLQQEAKGAEMDASTMQEDSSQLPNTSDKNKTKNNNIRKTGQFNAAKLSPWVPTPKDAPWQPNEELQSMLKQVFPQDLKLTSHLRRAAESKEAHARVFTPSSGKEKDVDKDEELLSVIFRPNPLHHIDLSQYKVGRIPHIYYIPDYINEDEERQILEFVKNTPKELKSSLTKRTAQEWGCSMCEECRQSFVSDANMPDWVQQCTDMLVHDGIFGPSTFPNSVRVHEYEKGEGIGPHTDGPIYLPQVSVLSLASTSVMGFYPHTPLHLENPMEHYNDTFKFETARGRRLETIVMEPRSLLIFRGAAYYYHPHGVSDEEVEELTSEVANRHFLREKDIMRVERRYRVSLTTRNLLTRCNHQPNRAEYNMKRMWHLYHHLPLPNPLFTPSPLIVKEDSGITTESSSSPSYPSSSSSSLNSIGPLSPKLMEKWESKMDRIFTQQAALSAEVKELKMLLAGFISTGNSYQKETAGVLNGLTKSLLEVDSKLEDLMDTVQIQK